MSADDIFDVTEAPVPDFTQSAKTTKETATDLLEDVKLGTNKKRGGPPQLVKADHTAIVAFYTMSAFALAPINTDAATAVADSAEKCADTWMELASKNDNVRKAIRALLEGSAWSAVIMAHLPIAMALIPEHLRPPIFTPMDDAEIDNES